MQSVSVLKQKTMAARERADKLRRVGGVALSKYEIGVYFLLPLFLIMAGAMPTSGIFVMPIALVMLYLLYRRFDAPLPFAAIAGYGGFSLALNYDLLTVVYFVFLTVALGGLILSAQIKPYLLCVTVAAAAAVLGFLAGAGVVRLVCRQPLPTIAARYVLQEREDPLIAFVARYEYDHADLPAGVERIDRDDERYDAVTIEYLSGMVSDEARDYLPYHCLHLGGVFGGIAYFFAIALNRRTHSAEDLQADERNIKRSTRALGGVRREVMQVRDMRMPRALLWTCVLPAFIAGVALEVAGGFDALSATIMHAFATLPGAFAFVTLMRYFASLFRGKGAVAANIVFGILCTLIVISPTVLFFCSIVGVCDALLNLRYWTEFIRRE